MTTAIERLEQLLNDADDENDALREKIEKLECAVRGSASGWSLPREMDDDGISPVPRLEFAWTNRGGDGWGSYSVEYRLVVRHLLGHLTIIPLGLTNCDGGGGRNGKAPFDCVPIDLPFRDGAHAYHDEAHIGFPCFAVTPRGLVPIGTEFGSSQRASGIKHRREVSP